MRADFNKVIIEKSRHGSGKSFKGHRHDKAFKVRGEHGSVFGGRESMRIRYRATYDNKEFSDNLSPLRGWLRTCIGKNWDKCYSELKKNFDTRKTINGHILEHLFQEIELHAVVIEGKTMVLKVSSYSNEYVPINESYSDYYVCPKDGTVKVVSQKTFRQRAYDRALKEQQEKDKIFRVIDENNHLHLIDGTWFHFVLADFPEVRFRYDPPWGITEFKQNQWNPNSKVVSWDELSLDKKKHYGRLVIISGNVFDVLTKTKINGKSARAYNGIVPPGKYHVSKTTASYKTLKTAGLV